MEFSVGDRWVKIFWVCVVGFMLCLVWMNSGLLNSVCRCDSVVLMVGWLRNSFFVVWVMLCLCIRVLNMISRFRLMWCRLFWFMVFFVFRG